MKVIFIDPGHSIIDPGAVGYETEFRLSEAVSKYQAEYLREHYVCAPFVCPSDIDSLAVICKMANDMDAALYVSNHFNAGGGDGYENFVYSEKTRGLGEVFEKHVKAIGQNSRGVKVKKFYVLKYTTMPAVLNEGAFVDNWKDIQDWNDDAELKKLGIAYAKATAEYLDLEELTVPAHTYTLEQFVRDVQAATGSEVDGIAGSETIGNTPTVSAQKNSTHAVVVAIQKRLAALGYDVVGEADGIAGTKFEAAVVQFQEDNKCWADGEITARNKTWKKLLGME